MRFRKARVARSQRKFKNLFGAKQVIAAISPRPDCGKVFIKGDRIIWEVDTVPLLEVNISKIAALGEYTTVHALHRNEWFIVFVFEEDKTYQISTYADGMQEVLEKLSELSISGESSCSFKRAANFCWYFSCNSFKANKYSIML